MKWNMTINFGTGQTRFQSDIFAAIAILVASTPYTDTSKRHVNLATWCSTKIIKYFYNTSLSIFALSTGTSGIGGRL